MSDASPWLTIEQAAHYVQASVITLRRELKARRLRGYRLGGRKVWRLRAEDLDAWLRQYATPIEDVR